MLSRANILSVSCGDLPECSFLFVQRERIRAAKDLMEAKRSLEENQRKRCVSFERASHLQLPRLLLEEKRWLCFGCRVMESRVADQEEEKRARERIRQRIADDKVCAVCCSMLKTLLNYTKTTMYSLLQLNFFLLLLLPSMIISHPVTNPSFLSKFFFVITLDFPTHKQNVTLCSLENQMKCYILLCRQKGGDGLVCRRMILGIPPQP